MIRKQVYIEEGLERGLKSLAARTGNPEAWHVRAALREYLEHHVAPKGSNDPLASLVGLVGDMEGPVDVAENHDRYLYGSEPSP